jgi:uncharacterized protein YcbK (DUF882 family)
MEPDLKLLPSDLGPAVSRSLTRRRVLQLGAAVSLSLAVAPRAVFARETAARTISFHNLHTGENLMTTFWAEGDYVPEALREIDWVLRDFRTGDVKTIDPGLLDLLHTLSGKLDAQTPFQVISGYRSPATNAMLHERSGGVAAKSLHTQGQAIDIRLPDRALADVHRAALSLRAGGVGYYPSLDFVHVDTGRVRHWG